MAMHRRSFVTGLIGAAITAPSIVRAASLMPVKQMLILPAVDDNVPALISSGEYFTPCDLYVDSGVLRMRYRDGTVGYYKLNPTAGRLERQ